MITSKKPLRTVGQQITNQGFSKPSLYSVSGLINFGSESNANFVDVISVGPITSIDNIYINDTDITTGEFPLSEFYIHTGETETTPFEGNFPYVERAYSINKQADLVEGDDDTSTKTVFKRSVSSTGVAGVRISFTAPQFTHKDNKNRRKRAQAIFKLHLLDENGLRVKTETADTPYFYSSDPISVQITVLARDEDLQRVWDYEVEMDILNNYYRTVVTGNWSASIATELYKDTQTYKDIAMVSGKVVSSDVSGSTPNREYLINGYKVDVPVYSGPNQTFLGQFEKATSNSHAWNAMAVMVDDKWGAGLPLDKINIASFVEFDKYVSEILPDGSQRYKHSQELLKADNYFRIASQIVGAADGKLYEDTSGRIGVLIDRQTDNRRVVTSYDIQDEKLKITTVPDRKRTNYVEMEFSDETNNYQKNIISVQDDKAIVKNGLISEKLKSDTCTNPSEALRTIKKVLVNSQVATSTYVITVGHTHEDVQIGDVISLYERKHARVNYCGKTSEGTTLTNIVVDKRTPINLTGIDNPVLVMDNNRGVPTKVAISDWTDSSITLATSLQTIPEVFTSFAVESSDTNGIKPLLMKVMGVTDNKGSYQVECVSYNDSLYSHIENGTELKIPKTQIIPDEFEELTGLTVQRSGEGKLFADWDDASVSNYVYYWRKFTNNTEEDPSGTGSVIDSGEVTESQVFLEQALDPVKYTIYVHIFNRETGDSSFVKEATIDLSVAGASPIQSPINLRTGYGGTSFIGRTFDLQWDHDDTPVGDRLLSGYLLKISREGTDLEIRLPPEARAYSVTEPQLSQAFGADYDRSFIATLTAYDDLLQTTPELVEVVSNLSPQTPDVVVNFTGDLELSTVTPLNEDVVGTVVYVWEGQSTGGVRPEDARVFRTNDLETIDVPEDFLVYDNRSYVFEVAWFDTFGEKSLNYERQVFAFGPDVLTPEPLNLEAPISFEIDSIKVPFIHNGEWLKKLKIYYRFSNSEGAYSVSDILDFTEIETDTFYDQDTLSGYFILRGLEYNSEYEIYATVANTSSVYSLPSNVVIGDVLPFVDLEEIQKEIDDANEKIDNLGGVDRPFTFQDLIDSVSTGVFGEYDNLERVEDIQSEERVRKQQYQQTSAELDTINGEVSATITRVDNVEILSDGNAIAISTLETRADNADLSISGNASNIQAVTLQSNGNASAINALEARVDSNESFASAQLVLNAEYESEIDTVSARAFLGLDINNRVTGINIQGEPANTVIDFLGDKVRFVRPDDLSVAFQWSAADDEFIFDGKIIARDSTFTGTVTASTIEGTTINGGNINGVTFTGGSFNGGTFTGNTFIAGTVKGAKIEMIGSNFMKVQSATPFGPNNLIEWYGRKAGNVIGDQPIYGNLGKTNAITYLGDDGSAYFGGTIIAGTLTTAKATSDTASEIEVSSGVFGSNGGQIVIACGFSGVATSQSAGVCPSLQNPSVQIRLYEVVGGSYQLAKIENYTGLYSCSQEGGDMSQEWEVTGSFTFFDNQLSTSNREYVLQATLSNMGLENRSQRLSIVTQEA